MFPLGHVGIGTHLIPSRQRAGLPWRWLALGCLLPDLLDKPVWLTARWASGAPVAPSALLATARLFGHTLFMALALAGVAAFARSPRMRAIAFGVPTHLLVDLVSDTGFGSPLTLPVWLLWPFFAADVPLASASILQDFAGEFGNTVYIFGEALGAALLLWDYAHARETGSS